MPDSGPYSLLILSFAVFSFVAWQLRGRSVVELGFGSAFVMVVAAARLFMGQMLNILPPARPEDLTLALLDTMLSASFLVLLTSTAIVVFIMAVTADPMPTE